MDGTGTGEVLGLCARGDDGVVYARGRGELAREQEVEFAEAGGGGGGAGGAGGEGEGGREVS